MHRNNQQEAIDFQRKLFESLRTFTKLEQARCLADFEVAALGHSLNTWDERWAARDPAVHQVVLGTVTAPSDLIKVHFKLAVLEMGLASESGMEYWMYCLSHFVQMSEIATNGDWRDIVDCTSYGWPLAAHIAEQRPELSEFLARTMLACVDNFKTCMSATSNNDTAVAAQFSGKAYMLIASSEKIRQQPDDKMAGKLLVQLKEMAAQLDEMAGVDLGFSEWVQKRCGHLSVYNERGSRQKEWWKFWK